MVMIAPQVPSPDSSSQKYDRLSIGVLATQTHFATMGCPLTKATYQETHTLPQDSTPLCLLLFTLYIP